jgi:hypothetical protein
MRKFLFTASTLLTLGLGCSAFAGDVTINSSTVNATAGSMAGQQTATAVGKNSVAQAGVSSLESAGGARIVVSNSQVSLTSTLGATGTNTATAVGASSVAQAGVASIQSGETCNCAQ